jgi:hypothetical protein
MRHIFTGSMSRQPHRFDFFLCPAEFHGDPSRIHFE